MNKVNRVNKFFTEMNQIETLFSKIDTRLTYF